MMNGYLNALFRVALLVQVACIAIPSALADETVEYIHTDALGSPVAITDAFGNVIAQLVYEPYGGPVGASPTEGIGYTGHVQDSLSSLIYMQQRYYDPHSGRMLSVDPITAHDEPMSAFNRYWYASDNPYRYIDPDGRRACGKDTGCRLDNGERGGTLGGARTAAVARVAEPRIMPAGSMAELVENTFERVARRTSASASGGLAAGLGVEGVATKTSRAWQRDRIGIYKVIGVGAFAGANLNFRVFSWGDSSGTTDLALKGNPLGYAKLRLGAGLSVGLSTRFNDHGGGTLSISAGGGFGAQAIVKPPAMGGWEKEL